MIVQQLCPACYGARLCRSGHLPEEGSGSGRSLTDRIVAEDSEAMNMVQLDFPAMGSELDMQRWIYADLELILALSVGRQVLTSLWKAKIQGICLEIA